MKKSPKELIDDIIAKYNLPDGIRYDLSALHLSGYVDGLKFGKSCLKQK